MNWILVKNLSNSEIINDFEKKYEIEFPDSFKEIVRHYNGGRPRPNTFDSVETKERVVKGLLSFNKQDRENIWDTYENLKERLPNRVFPIISDPFGNYICMAFNATSKESIIVFWNHETSELENVANNFSGFLKLLYELDE